MILRVTVAPRARATVTRTPTARRATSVGKTTARTGILLQILKPTAAWLTPHPRRPAARRSPAGRGRGTAGRTGTARPTWSAARGTAGLGIPMPGRVQTAAPSLLDMELVPDKTIPRKGSPYKIV